ncbi:hypothetical protein Pint_22137 [Pistacia integerrima]|uniref:Uncharacterized protein n=1 Tax=Pistacia integerrima TaxID=434235 RepID=A0ACC0YJF6_9ROSI|nr:hypothetical protein Pint_22137 [Pistacia integerrima]
MAVRAIPVRVAIVTLNSVPDTKHPGPNSNSGKVYVKRISYNEQIISVVDINLAKGSCQRPHKSATEIFRRGHIPLIMLQIQEVSDCPDYAIIKQWFLSRYRNANSPSYETIQEIFPIADVIQSSTGFELSASNNKTQLKLPSSSSDYYVPKKEISYHDSIITIRDVQETTCPIQSLLPFNITNSKFVFFPSWFGRTLVNCTETVDLSGAIGPVECVSGDKNFVYVIDSDTSMDELPSACRTYKSFDVSTEFDLLKALMRDSSTPEVVLEWEDFEYGCQGCEKLGDICRFNITSNSTVCLKQPHPRDGCQGREKIGDICRFNITSNSTVCLKQPRETVLSVF